MSSTCKFQQPLVLILLLLGSMSCGDDDSSSVDNNNIDPDIPPNTLYDGTYIGVIQTIDGHADPVNSTFTFDIVNGTVSGAFEDVNEGEVAFSTNITEGGDFELKIDTGEERITSTGKIIDGLIEGRWFSSEASGIIEGGALITSGDGIYRGQMVRDPFYNEGIVSFTAFEGFVSQGEFENEFSTLASPIRGWAREIDGIQIVKVHFRANVSYIVEITTDTDGELTGIWTDIMNDHGGQMINLSRR